MSQTADFFDILRAVGSKGFRRVLERLGRFTLSSLLGFVVDNLLFSLVMTALLSLQSQNLLRRHDILIALAVARTVSATVNYAVNKRFVFRSRAPVVSSFSRYWILVAVIAALSYVGTAVLSFALDLREAAVITAGKIAVDAALFLLSYKIQRIWVF